MSRKKRHVTPNTGSKPTQNSEHANPPITATSTSPPQYQAPHHHCEITCKQERDWWDTTKDLAGIVGVLLLAIYTAYTIKMYCANNKAANAAASAADTAAKQLELAERPWVDADVRINGPLTFDVNGANLNVLITLRNTGHSPAVNASIRPLILATFGSNEEPLAARRQLCADAAKSATSYAFGVTIFPNATIPYDERIGLGNSDIAKIGQVFGGKFKGRIIGPELILCIAYLPTFKTNTVYTTGYIFDVFKINSKTNLPDIGFTVGENIDAAHLRLRYGIGSVSAD